MKNLMFLLFALVAFAVAPQSAEAQYYAPPTLYQTNQVTAQPAQSLFERSSTFNVYSTQNGIQSLTPVQQIERTSTGYNIYNTSNGIRELFPSREITSTPTGLNIYNNTNGIRDLFPSSIIVPGKP